MTWDEIFGVRGPDRDYDEAVLGPILRADAALLGAVLNYTRPKIAIEYGCLEGHSAGVLCRFAETLYCVEVDNHRRGLIDVANANPNVVRVRASMTEWTPPVDRIDFVWFDASHVCADNLAALALIESKLSETAILGVHDTDTWTRPFPAQRYEDFLPHRLPVEREERTFIREMKRRGWAPVVFGCKTAFRHGLVLLQKSDGWGAL